ncbi:ATP-binding protein [Deinococcus fonticola]|uniref:ATP-binding protein n=1 Tax=Deinococcus fonticola TaxID=2528713 RepID=UPI0010750925|nr:ATP-binding protein [Deinococcus fonticola]
MFLGRLQELSALQAEYARSRPSLILVRGRRRVGKSTLILKSLEGRPHIYYQANRLTSSENLSLLRQTVREVLGDDPVLDGLNSWAAVLLYLARLSVSRPGLTLVLDEFPYLCDGDAALPSIVQQVWDRVQAESLSFNLVLCGSSIAFMGELLAERNPLHGRQTFSLDLPPLSYREASERFPDWSLSDRAYAFAVFGGMPYYLALCEPQESLKENVMQVILRNGAPLHDEPTHLLQAELQNVARYATILRAISDGCTTWGEILNRVPELESSQHLSPYIGKLEELRLVEVTRSLDAPPKGRNRRYRLADPFLAFWYHFVLPNSSALEAGQSEAVWQHVITPNLDKYMGDVFERICRDYLRLYGQERFGMPAREVGSIWSGDFDVDVVATLLDEQVVYGECKWWKDPVGQNILDHLCEKTQSVKYGKGEPQYALFARSGFTETIEKEGVHLLGLAALYGQEESNPDSIQYSRI